MSFTRPIAAHDKEWIRKMQEEHAACHKPKISSRGEHRDIVERLYGTVYRHQQQQIHSPRHVRHQKELESGWRGNYGAAGPLKSARSMQYKKEKSNSGSQTARVMVHEQPSPPHHRSLNSDSDTSSVSSECCPVPPTVARLEAANNKLSKKKCVVPPPDAISSQSYDGSDSEGYDTDEGLDGFELDTTVHSTTVSTIRGIIVPRLF